MVKNLFLFISILGDFSGVPVQLGHVWNGKVGFLRLATLCQTSPDSVRQSCQRTLLSPRHLPQHIPPSRTHSHGLFKNGN